MPSETKSSWSWEFDLIKFVAIEDTLMNIEAVSGRDIPRYCATDGNRRHLFKTRDLEALEDVDLHIRQNLVAPVLPARTHFQQAFKTLIRQLR